MNINYRKKDTQEEPCLSYEMVSSFCSNDQNEVTSVEEICDALSSSQHIISDPKDVTSESEERKPSDQSDKAKRQRSMEHSVMVEKKRRSNIRDKVDMLHKMTNRRCSKSSYSTKLDNIVEYIMDLQHEAETLSMAYTLAAGYKSPFHGSQAPYMSPNASPRDYYQSRISTMSPQNVSAMPPQNFSTMSPQNVSSIPQSFPMMHPQNVSTMHSKNFSTMSPQNVSTIPQSFPTMHPQNVSTMHSQNLSTMPSQNVPLMPPQNFPTMFPQNFPTMAPLRVSTMQSQNFSTMAPQNVSMVLPQNVGLMSPQFHQVHSSAPTYQTRRPI